MKRILLPELGTKTVHVLNINNFGSFVKDEIVFAYDGIDLIAWLWVQEIDELNSNATLVIINSSTDGE